MIHILSYMLGINMSFISIDLCAFPLYACVRIVNSFSLRETTQRKEKYASTLQTSVEELKDLPPALIQVAENDILRDEGEAYGRKLEQAGVKVLSVRYDPYFRRVVFFIEYLLGRRSVIVKDVSF
jgi:alpha/beta hydrolase fold